MKRYLAYLMFFALALATQQTTQAQLAYSAVVGDVPNFPNPTLETFDEGQPTILTFDGPAFLATGWGSTTGGLFVPPNYSGNTAAYFGETPTNGFDESQFVVVGEGGTATFNFPVPESFFGILIGSVDPGNTLTFYDGFGNIIGTIVGTQISQDFGDVGPSNSFYLNITSSVPFSSVVVSFPTGASVEFDDIAYASLPVAPVLQISNMTCLTFSQLLVGTNYQVQQLTNSYWTNEFSSFTATDTVYSLMFPSPVDPTTYRLAIAPGPIQAIATPQMVNGFVVGAYIALGGSGYLTNPPVSIVGGSGYGATAIAQISGGSVTNIVILDAGFGYTIPPTIQIAPPSVSALYPVSTPWVLVSGSYLISNTYYEVQAADALDDNSWQSLAGGPIVVTNSINQPLLLQPATNGAAFYRLVQGP